jgi:TPR repeat protein
MRRWLERAATAGHTHAMIALAMPGGREIEPDREWLTRSANAGNSDAMVYLAALLGDSDPEAARAWEERAIATGDTGVMHEVRNLLEARAADAADQPQP